MIHFIQRSPHYGHVKGRGILENNQHPRLFTRALNKIIDLTSKPQDVEKKEEREAKLTVVVVSSCPTNMRQKETDMKLLKSLRNISYILVNNKNS